MLKHPWIIKSEANKVNMAKWIRQVWGWPGASSNLSTTSTLAKAAGTANAPKRRPEEVQLELELERGIAFQEEDP